jgi:uncharacterized protein
VPVVIDLIVALGSAQWDPSEDRALKPIEQIIVPPATGKAFMIGQGQRLRIVLHEGAQVIDFDAFNRENFKETVGSSVTRGYEGAHLTTGSRIWTNPPYERPMFVITADTVRQRPDPRGARSHDMLGGRCTHKRRLFHYGSDTPGCQENIASAIAEFGLGEEAVHDPFNIFMKTGLDADGKYFWVEPDAVKGDYIELQAEIDCLVAISTCPGRSSGPVNHAVTFEIYGPDTSQ